MSNRRVNPPRKAKNSNPTIITQEEVNTSLEIPSQIEKLNTDGKEEQPQKQQQQQPQKVKGRNTQSVNSKSKQPVKSKLIGKATKNQSTKQKSFIETDAFSQSEPNHKSSTKTLQSPLKNLTSSSSSSSSTVENININNNNQTDIPECEHVLEFRFDSIKDLLLNPKQWYCQGLLFFFFFSYCN